MRDEIVETSNYNKLFEATVKTWALPPGVPKLMPAYGRYDDIGMTLTTDSLTSRNKKEAS